MHGGVAVTHYDKRLVEILDEKVRYPFGQRGNVLVCGSDEEIRMHILSLVRDNAVKQLSASHVSLFEVRAKVNRRILEFLAALADDEFLNRFRASSRHVLIVIEELAAFLESGYGRDFEHALGLIAEKDSITIVAATKYASAETVTKVIREVFPTRISSLLSCDVSSRLLFAQREGVHLAPDEAIVKLDDDVFICSLSPSMGEGITDLF